MTRDLNETKRQRFKRHLGSAQERAAKMLGTKRMGVLASKDIEGDCKKFVLLAKSIEESAKKIKYTELAKIARQYKIDMKRAYEKYKQQIQRNGESNQTEYQKACNLSMLASAQDLLNVVLIQAQNMISIYYTAYQFSEKLYGNSNVEPMLKLPIFKGNPDLDNLDNLKNISIQQANIGSAPIYTKT